jgi:hypothetical protein
MAGSWYAASGYLQTRPSKPSTSTTTLRAARPPATAELPFFGYEHEVDSRHAAGTSAIRYNNPKRAAGRALQNDSDWEDMMSNPLTIHNTSTCDGIPSAFAAPKRPTPIAVTPARSRFPAIPAHRSRRRWSRVIVTLGCAASSAIVLLPAAIAQAGTYTIGDCPNAFNHTLVAGPWQFFGPSTGVTLRTECGASPYAIFFAIPELPATPMGFQASTAGTGLSIVTARLWWRAFGSPSAEVEAETETTDEAGEDLAIGQADGNGELVAHMSEPEELRFPASDQATTIKLGEHCYLGGKCPMSESFGVGIEIFGAELTLNDESPPALSITGVQDEGGSVLSGPVQATFNATDPGAGVKKAELLLNGAAVATHEYSSSCSYTKLQPCPGSITDRLESPDISFLEGAHQLAVRVTDAAENTTVTAVPPVPNGAPCPNPTIALTADHRANAVTVPFGHEAIIEGRVGCGATPVPGASVTLATSTLPGGPAAPSAPLRTGPDGTFRYKVPSGPSRTLTFGYRAYSDEPVPTTQTAIKIIVKPRITLHISPRRTHNGGTIIWHGRVEGGPYPVDGMPLLVQVKEGKRWQTFDQLQVHKGAIGYRYTFLRTSRPTSYSFRVALPRGGDVGYPYATGASHQVRVHVR